MKFESLCESIIGNIKHRKKIKILEKLVEEVQKQIGGKIKNVSEYDDVNGKYQIEISLVNPNLYGDYGKRKEDMKVEKINFNTNETYLPKIDMVYYFNDGTVTENTIKTASDAFNLFKDIS